MGDCWRSSVEASNSQSRASRCSSSLVVSQSCHNQLRNKRLVFVGDCMALTCALVEGRATDPKHLSAVVSQLMFSRCQALLLVGSIMRTQSSRKAISHVYPQAHLDSADQADQIPVFAATPHDGKQYRQRLNTRLSSCRFATPSSASCGIPPNHLRAEGVRDMLQTRAADPPPGLCSFASTHQTPIAWMCRIQQLKLP